MGYKTNLPLTQVRRLAEVLDFDEEGGDDHWWNDEWEKEKGKPLFWERMQDPEDLLEWQTAQPDEESEDSEDNGGQEA